MKLPGRNQAKSRGEQELFGGAKTDAKGTITSPEERGEF